MRRSLDFARDDKLAGYGSKCDYFDFFDSLSAAKGQRFLGVLGGQAAGVMEVMWVFTPLYQYRKPSISTTAPICRVAKAV